MKILQEYTIKCNWDKSRICDRGFMCGGCEHQPADDDKPNGKNDPVKIEYKNDYGMLMPYCPSCGEMAYSYDRCVFCGQKFIDKKPPKNKMEIIGATNTGAGYKCDKCGVIDPLLTLESHTDGQGFFDYTYRCDCGNRITVRTLLNEFESEDEE